MGMKEIETVIQEIIDAQNADPFDAEATTDALTDALDLLEKQPEIIRCKDCKYGEHMCQPWSDIVCAQNIATHIPDWFCADGERK